MDNGISIVIPVWNNMQYLPKLFETLKPNTEIEHEIIIVDQGSNDGSIEFCIKQGVDLMILNKKNTGSCGAWNKGMHYAKYPLVMVLNSDTEIKERGWLKIMSSQMKRRTAIVECLEVTPLEKVTRWAGAACFLLRKEAWQAIGGFDENFFPGFNGDTDFWCRLAWDRWEIAFLRQILIFHWCGGTHRREGMLKETQMTDWKAGEVTRDRKWNVQTYNELWWGLRKPEEIWLDRQREAGVLK